MLPGIGQNTPPNSVASRPGTANGMVMWDTGDGTNLGDFSVAEVDIRGVFSAGMEIQGSNDGGVNWNRTYLFPVDGSGGSPGFSGTNTARFAVTAARYRAVLVSWASGSMTCAVNFAKGFIPALTAIGLNGSQSDIGFMHPLAPTGATGAATKHRLVAAATTNATSVSGVANKRLIGGAIANVSAALKYLKFFNKATAPTVGTDVPVLTIPLPIGQATPLSPILSDYGSLFATGLAYAITGAAPDLDTTAVAAGDVIVQLEYI